MSSPRSIVILSKTSNQALKKDERPKPFSPGMLIGQIDEVLDNFGKSVWILVHQAVACPFDMNQPEYVYPLGKNK
jgi:hypothetical protein